MVAVEVQSPTPRRISAPSWLDRRFVLGVVLVLAAVFVGARVVASARHTLRRVAVVADLASGTTLRTQDLAYVDVQLPASASDYLSDVSRAVGKTLSLPLRAGDLLPAAALVDAPTRTTLTVPFGAGAAPRLARGERIVVWLSTPSCPSTRLLDDVAVEDVTADAASFGAGGTGQDVVVSVSPALADRVVRALAIDGATIRAGVISGASPTTSPALPSLSGCARTSGP